MNFIYVSIAVFFGIWIDRIYTMTEVKLRENELLEEIRKLCNELLKIKGKGTIEIKSLNVLRGKGSNRVTVTTIPKGELRNDKAHEEAIR